MDIQLPRNTDTWLRHRASKAGMTAREFAAMALTSQASQESIEPNDPHLVHEDWIADLRAWSNGHPRDSHEVDDSRESIYEGRGL